MKLVSNFFLKLCSILWCLARNCLNLVLVDVNRLDYIEALVERRQDHSGLWSSVLHLEHLLVKSFSKGKFGYY
jgi:hypothetical protein